jgi:hypothetical protein
MVTSARVVTPGQTGVNPVGTDIPILDGDVVMDGTADVRSTLDLTTDGGLWPTRASSLLTPYGNEIHVRRGVKFGNGTVEWVSLGYFRIDTPEQRQAPTGTIRVSAQDRMAGITEARMLAPVQFPIGTTLGAIFTRLVTEVYPWATIQWDDGTNLATLGRALICEEDRYQFLADLVTAAAKTWYWDHRGVLVIKTPAASGAPVWDVTHGEGGVLVELSRRLTRRGVYNGVVATGEAADTRVPARAVAVDANPSSPTYWYGSFGKVPRFFASPLLGTNAAAQAAANTLLRQYLGLPYNVDFDAVPNPALEPGDPVNITYPGRAETHVLDRLTVPLTASGALSASTREQTLIVIGGT